MDRLASNHCPGREILSRPEPGRFAHFLLRLLLLLCLAWLFPGCSSSDHEEWVRHSEWSAETQFNQWPNVGHRGLAVGFVETEHRNTPPSRRPSTHEFHIQEGEAFTTLLILATGYSEPYPVLVSVFLDYKQIRFTLDGQQGLLHYLEIEPGMDMEIPLEVPVETPGWHDLFVVAFREPDYHPTDSQERLPPNLGVGGRRTVVCAGVCTTSTQLLPEALVGQGTDARTFNAYAYPLFLDDGSPPKQRLLLSAPASPGETFALEVWARNPSDQMRNYLVLSLLDFKQTGIADSSMLHLHMPPGSELFIPGQIGLPDEEGTHELQLIYIFDPYQALDSIPDPFVQSNMRSALVVEGDR